jgi:hypothetical protein
VESGCCLTLLRPRLATALDLVDNVFMIREYMEAAMAAAEYEPLEDSSEIRGRIPEVCTLRKGLAFNGKRRR